MSVNALGTLVASIHPLGYEVILEWQLPATLPDNFQVVVFKKKSSSIPDVVITNYFDNPSVPTAGVDVFELDGFDDPRSPYGMSDYDVLNGSTYYYRAVIYDVGGDNSTSVDANATPATNISTESVDAKEAVLNVVKRLCKAYGLIEKKHYTIHRGYSIESQKPLAIYVTRTSGQELHQYLGQMARNTTVQQLTAAGQMDMDIIQVICEDPSDKQRDDVAIMFREGREAMKRYLQHPDGGNLVFSDIIVEGDVINQSIKDRIQVGIMIVFQCGVETVQTFTEEMASWVSGEGAGIN